MNRTFAIIIIPLFLMGCETFMHDQGTMREIARANQRVKISEEARDFCENQPMVGIQKGFTSLLRLKKMSLKMLKEYLSSQHIRNFHNNLKVIVLSMN